MAEPDHPQINVKDGDVRLSALLLVLSLPPECESGVALNIEALADHAAVVRRALQAQTGE